MSNRKFETVEEVYAVVFGVLGRSEGKIVTSRFNKIINSLGLDSVKAKQIEEEFENIRQDEHLNSIKNEALSGKVTLDDLDSVEGVKVFDNNDYSSIVSTYVVENERRLSEFREFRKHSKEGAHLQILMEDLKEAMLTEFDNRGQYEPFLYHEASYEGGNKELIVGLSDFHVGAVNSDYTHGGYNFTILTARLNKFLRAIQETLEERPDIKDITVYFVGDLVEHISMRDVNQAFETEFTLAEQISKGTRLLVETLQYISNMTDGRVRFGIVGGNHDRMQGNKNQKIYNDNVAYIVLDMLFMMKDNGLIDGVELIDNRKDIYTIRETVAGKSVVVNHGDFLKGKGKNITKFIEDVNIDLLLTGHVHHFSTTQEDFNRMHVVVSSPMGYNNYAKELLLSKTKPSQQLIILDDRNQDIEIKTVFLD